jgi:hypothetical protein
VLAALLTLQFSLQVNHLLSVLNIAALVSVLHFCYLLVLLTKISYSSWNTIFLENLTVAQLNKEL